jgi:hypothetical protein
MPRSVSIEDELWKTLGLLRVVTEMRKGSVKNSSVTWQYLITPWSRVLLQKLTGSQLVKKFPTFYGTRRFITAFTSARHLSLSIKVSGQIRGLLFVSQHTFLRWGVVSTSPNSHAGVPPLFGCPRLLIQYIRSYLPYWRSFLHPQPEDAPCRGDRDPHSQLPSI